MMKGLNDKVYAALRPEERFKATLAARARGDETEFKRLVESCPWRDYRQHEAGFVDRMGAVEEMGMVVLIGVLMCDRDMVKSLAAARLEAVARRGLEIMVLDNLRANLTVDKELPLEGDKAVQEAVNKALGNAMSKGEWPDTEAAVLKARGEAAGVMAAVEGWCQEIGLPLDDFLAINPILTSEWKYLKYVLADAEPDEETKTLHLDALQTAWGRLTRNVVTD